MNLESPEQRDDMRFFVDAEYGRYFPPSFRKDPFAFFENFGTNVKAGQEKYFDETGRLREDPTAVKDIELENSEGQHFSIVGKRVNLEKGKVAKSGNPLHEFQVMTRAREAGLPVARPLAYAVRDGEHILFMERVRGARFTSIGKLLKTLREQYSYTDLDITNLQSQLEARMGAMQKDFEKAGIRRSWNIKDMVADIDFENRAVRSLVPVDWERAEIVE